MSKQRLNSYRLTACALFLACSAAPSALAEGSISIFGGANFSPHAGVDYNLGNGTIGKVTPKWDGASFEAPPYYGVRGTWWLDSMPEIGIALEFTHAKVKADPVPAPFTKLEFTDGINFVIANVIYRHPMENGFTPYAGLGAGLSIPHVEAVVPGVTNTMEYQVTGAAVQGLVGVDYRFDEHWSVFGEFKSTYGQVDADLNGGGNLDTHVVSNQILVGVTYKIF